MHERHGIHKLLNEVEAAVNANCYYVAMLGLLTVPDMVAALANPTGESNGTRYTEWFDTNVTSPLTGSQAWRLRCALLHEARTRSVARCAKTGGRVAFAEPHPTKSLKTGYMAGNVMLIHVPDLCDAILGAARRWLDDKQDDPTVAKNLDKTLLRSEATHGSSRQQVNTGIIMVMSTE